MKKQGILILAIAFCCILSSSLKAQNYSSAIGLRLGSPSSISYKQFLSDANAVEVYVGFRNFSSYSWFNISGAYQVHTPIPSVEGLQWYFGGGASLFFWSYDNSVENEGRTSIGLQGYLGLDYTFPNAPVNLSIDWVPTFFLGRSGFGAGYGTLAVRYILGS